MKSLRTSQLICILVLVIFYIFCMAVPQISNYTYFEMVGTPYEHITSEHWFGTDGLGRDLLVRVCIASRTSIHIACFSIICSMLIGVLYGCFGGYHNRTINMCFTAIIDIIESVPDFLCAMLLMTFFNDVMADAKGSILGIFVTLVLTSWTEMARIIKNETMIIVEENYIKYARQQGAKYNYILIKHLIPNLKYTIIVTAVQKIPSAIFLESFLSFIGIGIQPPFPSLGRMITEGVTVFRTEPYVLLIPSIFLFIIVFLFNIIGRSIILEQRYE